MPRKKFEPLPLAFCRNMDARTWINSEGYILEYCPAHPSASPGNRGIFYQHRLEMEQFLGRQLECDEMVHHVDENRTNNGIENLELCFRPAHQSMHATKRHATSPKNNEKLVSEILLAAASGEMMKKDYCKKIGLSGPTVSRILTANNAKWVSPLEKKLDPLFVEQTLRQFPRTEALKILGCSVQHLWNKFPELMSMTSNRKLKKWGGQWDVSAPQAGQEPSHKD